MIMQKKNYPKYAIGLVKHLSDCYCYVILAFVYANNHNNQLCCGIAN